MSQEKLAELAGLSYKYIGRIELARADPGADVLVRLARALGVPVGELFETITPPVSGPRMLPAAEVEHVRRAMGDLASALQRLLEGQPGPSAPRSPRRTGQ